MFRAWNRQNGRLVAIKKFRETEDDINVSAVKLLICCFWLDKIISLKGDRHFEYVKASTYCWSDWNYHWEQINIFSFWILNRTLLEELTLNGGGYSVNPALTGEFSTQF